MFKGSYKTTIGGSVTSLGAALMGASAFGWMPHNLQVGTMYAGFLMVCVGPFLTGIFARDNNKSSEDVGVKQ